MIPLNIMAVFCEDIREEKGGTLSLIGVVPDNINISNPPNEPGVMNFDATVRMLSKLCIYIRINFDPEYDLPEAKFRLILPNNDQMDLGGIDPVTIKRAQQQAKDKGNPLAGVIGRIILAGFRIPSAGLLKLEVILDKEIYLGGALNFQLTNPPSST
jgi:hypothetical protein